VACAILDKAGIAYEKLLSDEHKELALALGIKQAPTLVIVKDGEVQKFAGVSDIKRALKV
jgi:ribonucleoside-triphosphate reductase